jgi:hypothetical protein
MKKSDKGFVKPVKKEEVKKKSLCGRNDCYKQTRVDLDGDLVVECVTCGKILEIR